MPYTSPIPTNLLPVMEWTSTFIWQAVVLESSWSRRLHLQSQFNQGIEGKVNPGFVLKQRREMIISEGQLKIPEGGLALSQQIFINWP